jgi:hydroxyacyl-ACP dehydratase HTD2-like protein with hotdog domain
MGARDPACPRRGEESDDFGNFARREFDEWIGSSHSVTDVLEPARSNALDVALGGEGGAVAGDVLPLLHHWLHFWDVKPPMELGEDGHPAKGGFLPPVALPRRMWAGGRLKFKVADQLDADADRMALLETTDNGKVIRETHNQMGYAARIFRYCAG